MPISATEYHTFHLKMFNNIPYRKVEGLKHNKAIFMFYCYDTFLFKCFISFLIYFVVNFLFLMFYLFSLKRIAKHTTHKICEGSRWGNFPYTEQPLSLRGVLGGVVWAPNRRSSLAPMIVNKYNTQDRQATVSHLQRRQPPS